MRNALRFLIPLFLLAFAATGRPTHARAAERAPGELIVGYRAGVRAAERAALIDRHRVFLLRRFRTIPAELVRVVGDLDSAMVAIAADPRVAYVEPNAILHADAVPDDPRFPEQWALRNTGQTGGNAGADVDAVAAWDAYTGSEDLRIGVIDSGIDFDHPDLVDNLWTNPGEIAGNQLDDDGNGYIDDVHGYDFANRDPNPDDDFGHGTHVAGIIAARGDNGIGVAGLAWRARLVAIKFLDSSGSGSTAAAIEAVEYGTALGLRITCNSWGGPEFSQALRSAIEAAGAAGQVFAAAAGNRGEDNDAVSHYPSSYDLANIVAVAATDAADALAAFSNYGATSVDIAAPGVAILSCLPGGLYGTLSGTSMATPLVAATVALLMGRSPALTPTQAIALLLGGAEPLASLEGLVANAARLNTLRAVADPDTVSPGAVQALRAIEPGSNTIVLEWLASGDDGDVGLASHYDIRLAQTPIDSTNVATAVAVAGPPPGAPGELERFEVKGLATRTTYWFVVRARDEFGNPGPLTPAVSAMTLGPPALATTPAVILASLPVGARDTALVSILNTAEGTLDFTVPQIELSFPAGGSVAATPDQSEKGEAGLAGTPVAAGSGGPDGMGYRWIDSRDPVGPAFQWVDVVEDGTRVPLTGDDALSAPIDIGFDFPFYGTNVRSARVSTNGLLTFSDGEGAPVNQVLPAAGAPPFAIAPFWDDLLFASVERAWYRADPDRFVITWLAVPHYGSGGPYSFQALLHANGEIRFQYLEMGHATLSATAGIQNGDRTIGLTVAHNTAFFEDSLAVRIVPLPQWASASPTSGRVLAGERMDLKLALDARGLLGGGYDAALTIRSNDPVTPEYVIPIRLVATGAPDLVFEPAAIDFGDVFVGAAATRTLTCRNPGTEWLSVSEIESDEPAVELDVISFSLAPGARRELAVSFRPVSPGNLAAALRVHSNVAGGSVTPLSLAGRSLAPPVLAVEPSALRVQAEPFDEVAREVWIENQGAAPLSFTARATSGASRSARAIAAAALEPRARRAPEAAGISAGSSGGPDAFGYTFRTSDTADGPRFEWIDASAGGVPLSIRGDDATSVAQPIGFDFPFYGGAHQQFRVCTNGWLSFTSGLASFANTALPSAAAGVPENLIAPYWDDFHFAEGEHAWVLRAPDRTVIQWQEVGRLDDAARPNSFQVILEADGRIRFQYLRMKGENLRSGTAGIQNGARDDGLTAAFNTVFAHDSLAIEFVPPARWFEVSPATGEVAPGEAIALDVRVHPRGIHAGTYTGAIELTSNDPSRRALAVPCTLRVVGAATLVARPADIRIDPAYVGFARTVEVEIRNEGTAAFDLLSASGGDPALAVMLEPSRIAAGEAGRLRVVLMAGREGPLESEIVLRPVEGAALVIPVRATITPAPRAVTAQPRLEATLANGLGERASSQTRDVVIANEGGSPLVWSADVLLSGLPATSSIMRSGARIGARAKGVVAPAGRTGLRGPDAGGYHWIDSRDAGAPPFEWIDIDATGAPVPLDGDDQLARALPLPFDFPFYGRTFDAVRIGTNGYLSFSDSMISYANVELPDAAAPRDLVAPLWTDLDFRPLAGEARVRVATASDRFIVAFLDVPRFGGGPTSSFEVILSANGDIDFQYLRAGAGASDATIGLQNGRADVGLLVASGTAFVEDGLRVAIRRRPAWLAAEPASGVVAAGGRDTLRVHMRAGGYEEGAYTGAVRLLTGDPARPERILAASMRIALASVAVDLDPRRGGSGTPRWIDARVTPDAAIDPAALARANPTLAGIPATAPGTLLDDGAVVFPFPRMEVLLREGSDPSAPLELAGEVAGMAWVVGSDTLRSEGPRDISATFSRLRGGEAASLAWQSREGLRVDVYQSLDGGEIWTALARGVEDGAWRYVAPRGAASAAWLELEAHDEQGHAGSTFIGPFEIIEGERLPARFALAVAGQHPSRGTVAFELALPDERDVRVDIFDLMGARVATLVAGHFTAGRHRLEWDGTDRGGHLTPPGIYFARALAGEARARARIVLMR